MRRDWSPCIFVSGSITAVSFCATVLCILWKNYDTSCKSCSGVSVLRVILRFLYPIASLVVVASPSGTPLDQKRGFVFDRVPGTMCLIWSTWIVHLCGGTSMHTIWSGIRINFHIPELIILLSSSKIWLSLMTSAQRPVPV